jgi:hypothetical protein
MGLLKLKVNLSIIQRFIQGLRIILLMKKWASFGSAAASLQKKLAGLHLR